MTRVNFADITCKDFLVAHKTFQWFKSVWAVGSELIRAQGRRFFYFSIPEVFCVGRWNTESGGCCFSLIFTNTSWKRLLCFCSNEHLNAVKKLLLQHFLTTFIPLGPTVTFQSFLTILPPDSINTLMGQPAKCWLNKRNKKNVQPHHFIFCK